MTTRLFAILLAAAWFSPLGAQTAAPPPAGAPGNPPVADDTANMPTDQDDKDTIAASEKWLALLDAGKVGAAWDVSSAYLKSVVTRQKWIEGISSARKPFGKINKRTAGKFARTHTIPGAPDGDYAILEFDSVYANGKRATEQVIWMLEPGDTWRVSGYYIR